MKIKNIYDTAIRTINKYSADADTDGYEDRTPYIVATFCCSHAFIDRDFRESHGLPSQKNFNEVLLNMEDEFPLESRFSTPAAYFLAAMLTLDDDGVLSETLFGIFSDSITSVQREIPMKKGKIINVYI